MPSISKGRVPQTYLYSVMDQRINGPQIGWTESPISCRLPKYASAMLRGCNSVTERNGWRREGILGAAR